MPQNSDTIIARATPAGSGALAVLRISGPECFVWLDSITNSKAAIVASHQVKLRKFYCNKELADEGLMVKFAGPASFTGENMAELYLHGSDYIVGRLIEDALAFGLRLADPGEFTLRAFLNGKMDLAQAEAVADLIASENYGSHKLALNQLKGGVSNKIKELRSKLLEFAALIELELDFGEEDVEFADRGRLLDMLEGLQKEINELLSTFKSGNAIKEGVPVVIAGKPNAGKSTLLNALLKEDRAIVTDIPGTTRDTIEEVFYQGGVKYRLVDTAGMRDSADTVEVLGIERTYKSLEQAAIVILLIDASAETPESAKSLLTEVGQKTKGEIWPVLNKTDIASSDWDADYLRMSAKKGDIDALLTRLQAYSGELLKQVGDATITHARHADVLRQASADILQALEVLKTGQTGDILAFELRNAMAGLGRITGEIDSEEILGEIFGKFCIGK